MATTATTDRGGGEFVTTLTGGGSNVVNGSSGGTGTLASPVPDWSDEPVPLKDFQTKRKVPGFARVAKGSYMTIGSSKFSFQKQHHEVYFHSVKVGVKVLAHCMRRVEMPAGSNGGHHHKRGSRSTSSLHLPPFRLVPMDQRLTVPISYQGWFELLSEDGKAARPISGVPELAKIFPRRCLVRENIKAYLSPNEEPAADRKVGAITTFDKTKILPAGEQLKLVGVVSLPFPSEAAKIKLLRCIDSKDDHVFLSFDQKGLFTPIAEEGDFTGVFTIRDIVGRFRLPLTVKLAQGVKPRVSESKFSGLLRLEWVYSEETAFVCPLEKNHVRLLPVPCDVNLQLVAAVNQDELCSSEMFRSLQTKCARMVANYNNTLHLIVTVPEAVVKTRSTRASNIFSKPLESTPAQPPGVRRSKSKEDFLMDEIDDLYGYVRNGGKPPKSKFQYDSDEESYWEEPAYEPLDQFRARLKALESGQNVSYPSHYRPADPTQLDGIVGGLPKALSSPSELGLNVGASEVGEHNPTPPGKEAIPGVVVGSSSNGSSSVNDDGLPPPLPPRPADFFVAAAGTAGVGRSTSSSTPHRHAAHANKNVMKSASTAHHFDQRLKSSSQRRVSAPLPLSQLQEISRESRDAVPRVGGLSQITSVSSGNTSTTASTTTERYTATSKVTAVPTVTSPEGSPPRRVSRSGSEPGFIRNSNTASLAHNSPAPITTAEDPFPSSAAEARPSPRHRPKLQAGEDGAVVGEEGNAKLDWKERLRRFNAMDGGREKEQGSSSASSGSGQRNAARRMARDFKDSDLSSRVKGSSSGNSSGEKGVKKRMQTLYL